VTVAWARRVRALSGTGLAVGILVLLTSALIERPIPGIGVLLLTGVPIIALGQLFSIAVLTGEAVRERAELDRTDPGASYWQRARVGKRSQRTVMRWLPTGQRVAFTALFVVCALQGLLGVVLVRTPETVTPAGRCEASIDEAGSPRCVDPGEKRVYEAALQRFGGGVATGFCAFHTMFACALLARRRSEQTGPSSAGAAPPPPGFGGGPTSGW
jgi:hypothetical protein